MRTKKNPEMPMVPKAHLKNVEHQRDQYKTERENFEQMLNEECERGYQMEGKYHDMKTERDTLIDDLSWYKAKVSRLEENNDKLNEVFNYQENKKKEYREVIEKLEREIKDFDKDYEMVTNNCIYWEDKAHWLEDESSKYIDLLSEFSQHIGNKPSSSTYKYFRAKLDGIGIKEGD